MPDTRELLNRRGWDLLRQMRIKLLDEDLITDEEYGLLAVDHPAVKRLENYDVLRQQVKSLRAELAASAEVIKKTQDIYDDTVRECLEVRGQLDNEKQRTEALEAAFKVADWQQVVLNGGPPCFYIEGGRFCLRAKLWEGHPADHAFVVSPICAERPVPK